MSLSFYVAPFLTSFLVSTSLLFLFREISAYLSRARGHWSIDYRRFGGVAVILSFLCAVLFRSPLVVTPVILGIVTGSIAILFFGIWDDIVTLSWKIQLTFQISLGVALFAFGLRIFSLPVPFVGQVFVDTLPGSEILGFVVLVLWVVFVMNALNWVDGVDGLLPSVSLLAFFALFALSLSPQVNQPPLGILSIALAGAVFGLLLFNIPPSRFLSGTTGSLFIGFSLSSIAVLSGAKMATCILVLSLPMLDALWVFLERLRSGRSPFHGGDARHLHYRLRERGWSDRSLVVGYTIYTGVVGIIALSFGAIGKTMAFLVLSVLLGIFLLRMERDTKVRVDHSTSHGM